MCGPKGDRPFEPSELQLMFEVFGLGTEDDRAAFRRLAPEEKRQCEPMLIRVGTTTSDDEDDKYAKLA